MDPVLRGILLNPINEAREQNYYLFLGFCFFTPPTMSWYLEQLKHPEWQKKRLEIFNRDSFKCRFCGEKELQLHIHHIIYLNGFAPWEYKDELLITLCQKCHSDEEKLKSDDQFLISMFVQAGLSRRQLYSFATELRRHLSNIDVRHFKFTDLMDYLHE